MTEIITLLKSRYESGRLAPGYIKFTGLAHVSWHDGLDLHLEYTILDVLFYHSSSRHKNLHRVQEEDVGRDPVVICTLGLIQQH